MKIVVIDAAGLIRLRKTGHEVVEALRSTGVISQTLLR